MTAARQVLDGCLFGADREVVDWLCAKIGDESGPPPGQVNAIGFVDGTGELVAGASFYNARLVSGAKDLELSLAIEPQARVLPVSFRRGFHHVFSTLGAGRLTAEIRADNARSLRAAHWLGFKHEGTKRAPNGACDVLIYGLLAADCRFLKPGDLS